MSPRNAGTRGATERALRRNARSAARAATERRRRAHEYNSQNGKYEYEPYVYPPDVTKPIVFKDYAGERTGMINIGGALMAGQVPPFEPKDSYCPVGQTCDVACAEGFAGFDAAKNCKNANRGYCCK